ncbi:alpha/beta fold hydrolase, partial [Burkholderia sp. SIMBA_051]
DVAELLAHLNIERAHFCGLSMGGPTGLWLALNRPELIGKLILCNTAARIGSAEGWSARIAAVAEQTLEKMAPTLVERWLT